MEGGGGELSTGETSSDDNNYDVGKWNTTRKPTAVDTKAQFCDRYECHFSYWRYKKQGDVSDMLDFDAGCSSFQLQSAVECLDASEVGDYFKNFREYGSRVFSPALGFQMDSSILLCGSYVGNTEQWISKVKSDKTFWNYVENAWGNLESKGLNADIKRVCRQILQVMTKRHQNNQIIGNLLKNLNVNADTSEVTFTCFQKVTSLEDEILKDLNDFRQLLVQLMPDNDRTTRYFDVQHHQLFESLYPRDIPPGAQRVEKVKKHSFFICHSPLFWDYKERYRFINQVKKSIGELETFMNYVTLEGFETDMSGWFQRLSSNEHDPLRATYNFTRFKTETLGVIFFIRNVWADYFAQDDTQTFKGIDDKIEELFSDLYPKLYLEIVTKLNKYTDVKGCIFDKASLNYARYD